MSEFPSYSEAALSALRSALSARLSPRRFAHTLGVEETAARLAELYLPAAGSLLRAAALLHDLTKEKSETEQREILSAAGVVLRPDEDASPKIFHGITAALLIPREFPDFADPVLLSAVRYHTTGHRGMTLPEALLYLADYIEPGRTFADCVALRKAFFSVDVAALPPEKRLSHLRRVLLSSFDFSIAELTGAGAPVCLDTLHAREELAGPAPALLKGNKMDNETQETPMAAEPAAFPAEETKPSLADADAETVAQAALAALEDKKAKDPVLIPVAGRSDITDYLVLATGTSGTHVRALSDTVQEALAVRGLYPLRAERTDKGNWEVVDYGPVMVHVFDRESREFYHLDKLYKTNGAGPSKEETI